MQAASFLETLGQARAVVSDCRAARSASRDAAAWAAVNDVHAAACDFVDLCTDSLPLPALNRRPASSADEAVADVLADRYEELSDQDSSRLRTDGGRNSSGDDESSPGSATSYAAEDRIRTVAGRRIVPLSRTGPTAANWYVLGALLPGYVADVAADCRTLANRQRLGGSLAVATEWEAVADLLASVADLLEYHTSLARWVTVPDRDTVDHAVDIRTVAERLSGETMNTR
jgi:hypothetical protein